LNTVRATWKPPKYQTEEAIPFIPLEKEIAQLIANCSKKTATLLQLLKETGRIGEAAKLRWIDFDGERGTLSVKPLKGSNPPNIQGFWQAGRHAKLPSKKQRTHLQQRARSAKADLSDSKGQSSGKTEKFKA